jgi:hypothetical protein
VSATETAFTGKLHFTSSRPSRVEESGGTARASRSAAVAVYTRGSDFDELDDFDGELVEVVRV